MKLNLWCLPSYFSALQASSLHTCHAVNFCFVAWLSKSFMLPVVSQFTQSNQVSYSRSVQRSLRYSTQQLGILPREQCISKHMVDRPWPCQNEYPRCFILNIMRSHVSNNNAFNVKPPPPNHSLILERQGKLPELCEQSQCSNTDHTFTHLRKYWHRSLPSSDWLNLWAMSGMEDMVFWQNLCKCCIGIKRRVS